jgi:NDP-sugar pyrophosphorylase family protein
LNPSKLRAIIPVGGEAKRLKPLTAEVSKAVVRIFAKPIVEFAMAELAAQGVRNFIFGVKGYENYVTLFDYFKDGTDFSASYDVSPRVHIKYQPNVEDLGSADSVRINLEYYDIVDPVIVVQGDNLFDLDLASLLAFHEERKALMTVALTEVDDVEGYGIADLADDGRIRKFVEKPKKGEAPSKLANSGIYVLSPGISEVYREPGVEAIMKERGRLDFGMDFIPYLTENGHPVYGYRMEGCWYDVGTPRGYLKTMGEVLHGSRTSFYLGEPVKGADRVWIKGQSVESQRRRDSIVRAAMQGDIKMKGGVQLGRHCQVGRGTSIEESCVDNYCIIGEDVTIKASAILDRVVVGDGAEIVDSVIGRHVRVQSSLEHPTRIKGLCVLGNDVSVGEGCTLNAVKVFPHRSIPGGSEVANYSIQ